jgi:Tat protein secretion system quality control protein TatD with DNase activity
MFIDIGANLSDDMFRGVYHGKTRHEPDLDHVLARAWGAGLERIMVTAGNLEESRRALELAKMDPRLATTVGVHPTRAGELEGSSHASPEAYMEALRATIREGRGTVVAIGECGLDADRTHFCPWDVQVANFPRHFELAEETGLPMFLHDRNTAGKLAGEWGNDLWSQAADDDVEPRAACETPRSVQPGRGAQFHGDCRGSGCVAGSRAVHRGERMLSQDR